MKDRLRNFLSGRYGTDEFNKFLLATSIILILLEYILRSNFLYWLALALIIFSNYRMFSKDISKRYFENSSYIQVKNKVVHFFVWTYLRVFGKDGYKYLSCDHCKAELKIPKKKGKVKITCPKCKNSIVTRT